jgi:NADPH2:quinone reductase
MKAILMTASGGPEVLQGLDVPEPTLERGRQILVRLKAAGVNPVDTKLRSQGTYYPERMPCILGCDGAGIVESIGDAVSRFRVGDEVYFCNGGIGGEPGNYAEFTVVDERYTARKPSSLSFTEAAGAPLVLITAWESLFDRARMHTEQNVLIHGGAGGVGHVAIQLAKQAGCRVCTTVSSEDKAKLVAGLGADEVVNYRETDFADDALAWTNGIGVDIALDTVGGATFVKSFEAMRHYGDLVTILQPPPATDWKVARIRNLRVSLELMLTPAYDDLPEARQHQAEILASCARLCDEGKLRVEVSRTLPLADAPEAHRLIEAGGMVGKVVLAMD